MADAALLFVAVGVLLAGALAWVLTRRFGVWPGLAVPALAAGGAALRAAMPLGHPEEAMGRGIEVMMIWAPMVVVTLLGWGLGALSRRR